MLETKGHVASGRDLPPLYIAHHSSILLFTCFHLRSEGELSYFRRDQISKVFWLGVLRWVTSSFGATCLAIVYFW